jgi:hypothetical protein
MQEFLRIVIDVKSLGVANACAVEQRDVEFRATYCHGDHVFAILGFEY